MTYRNTKRDCLSLLGSLLGAKRPHFEEEMQVYWLAQTAAARVAACHSHLRPAAAPSDHPESHRTLSTSQRLHGRPEKGRPARIQPTRGGDGRLISDPYERTITALRDMSELVERYAYQHAPGEAADCQRAAHEAIEGLRAEKLRVGEAAAESARAA